MNELQRNLYEMLIEIDDICRKNDIVYYLGAGGALGAVRNQGFLPWDDDIDIYITRSNWIKLDKILNSLQNKDRSIVTMYNSDYYYNPLPRYVNKNTTLAYKPQILCGKTLGQHIEVFIFDPMPTKKEEIEEYKKLLLIYTELITPYFVVNRGVINSDSYFDYKLYNSYYKMSKRIGLQKTLKKIEEKLFRYSEEDAEWFCMRWGIRLYIFGKQMLGTPRLQKFEDRFFYIPEHVEEIFRIAYGDTWMYIPQIDAQITHDSYKDLNTPFKTYVDKYMKKINRKKILKAYRKKKRNLMKTLIKRETFIKNRLELKRLFIEEDYLKRIENNEDRLRLALKSENYMTINMLYNQIHNYLFSTSSKKYNQIVNLKEEYLYPYFMNLLVLGEYSKILELKERYQKNVVSIKEKNILEIFEVANCFRKISMYIYDYKDLKNAKSELDKVKEKFRNNIVYKRYFYILEVENKKNNQKELESLKEKLNLEIKNIPDGELFKLLGDCYYYSNDKTTAEGFYKKAHAKTRNGMMLLDIYIKTGNKDYVVVE